MLVLFAAAAVAVEPEPVPLGPPDALVQPAPVALHWDLAGPRTVTTDVTVTMQTPTGREVSHIVSSALLTPTTPGRIGGEAVAWTEQLQAFRLDVDMAGKVTSWDSSAKDARDNVVAGLESIPLLLDTPVQVAYGKGELTVAAPSLVDIAEKAGEAGVPGKNADAALGEAGLASASKAMLDGLVHVEIKVGTPVNDRLKLDVPGVGAVEVARTITLEKVEAGKAVMHETYALVAPPPPSEGGLTLAKLDGTGTTTWDVVGNAPVARTLDLTLDLSAAMDGAPPLAMPTTVHTQVEVH
jgi:hypothetical protein